jgi:hypothetical protein
MIDQRTQGFKRSRILRRLGDDACELGVLRVVEVFGRKD